MNASPIEGNAYERDSLSRKPPPNFPLDLSKIGVGEAHPITLPDFPVAAISALSIGFRAAPLSHPITSVAERLGRKRRRKLGFVPRSVPSGCLARGIRACS